MKILLISANLAETPYPVYPLGMGMVAAALSGAGHEVLQYDFLQHDASLRVLADYVRKTDPDVMGISIRNIDNVNLVNERRYLRIAGDIVKTLRTVSTARIVLGGSGFSLMPEAILAELGADYGVVGEGEEIMVEFVQNAARNLYPEQSILRAPPALAGRRIPPAIYDCGIMRYYLKHGKTAAIQTKRGCAHRCAYCSYPLLEGRDIRCRDPEAVVDDIEYVVREHGAELVFFTDSVFNDDHGRYLEVLRAMQARGVCTPWVAFFKPEPFDEKTLHLMKCTGLRAVELGADAPTDIALRGLAKSFRFADIEACNDRLAEHGVAVAHYYMFGGPGETRDTVREGIRNIVGLKKAVSFMFMGIRIIPGTPLEKTAVRDGIIRPGESLLEPVYYLSPGVDRDWLQKTLTAGFKGNRRCICPPDAIEAQVRLLHRLGYAGTLWDMLISPSRASAGQPA